MRGVCVRRRKVEKLQDICCKAITKNFRKVLSQPGPGWGIEFLQRKAQILLKAFRETDGQKVSLDHAKFCITPYIKELTLNWFDSDARRSVLRKLKTVETALVILNAHVISLEVLYQLIPVLPKTLECLCLIATQCSDGMMVTIAESCPTLLKLELALCYEITDFGVLALCPKDEHGNNNPNLFLQKIDLRFTRVTEKGLAFLLEKCPNLSELQHENLSKVIYEIYNKVASNDRPLNEVTYNLKTVHAERTCSPHCEVLKAFSILCPYITKLKVRIRSQTELSVCTKFALLEEAELDGDCNLLPFLEVKGRYLKSLDFQNRLGPPVSLDALIKLCPKLKRLSLSNLKFMEMKSISNRNQNLQCSLPMLTHLTVRCTCHENMEKSILYLISNCPNLEKLKFFNDNAPCLSSVFVNSMISCISVSTLKELKMQNVDINVAKLSEAFPEFNVQLY